MHHDIRFAKCSREATPRNRVRNPSLSKDLGGGRFPSLKDDGPIEAKGLTSFIAILLEFPSLKDDGPIEADPAAVGSFGGKQFPSLKDDGPIEAMMWYVFANSSGVVSVVERRRPH